jgi:hypothetical protein
MNNMVNGRVLYDRMRRANAWFQALVLISAALLPLALSGLASAAPVLTERELQSSTARPSQTTQLTWIFDTTSAVANIDHIEIEFCDAPLGTCTTTNVPTIAASPTATLTNFTSGGNSASRTNGDNGGTNNQILVDKTTADAGANLNEAQIQLGASDITNNATANRSYYTRMRIYSDAGTTLAWEGVFAQSTSQTLTITARVQERLDFCVGATSVNDATTSIAATCSAVTGTDVGLGVVETGYTNVSPVTAATAGGDNENGVAMVRTNATNGVVIDYKAIQETSSGKLKVVGATCSGVTLTDQCFNSVGTTQDEIDAGVEEFGMAVAGTNCGSTTAYTCTFSSSTYNLVRDTEYDGVVGSANTNTYIADAGQVSGTTAAAYAWDDTGTADRIASSAGSSVKVVDDEALVLKFAATPSATTPTGSYQVQADFIATATF